MPVTAIVGANWGDEGKGKIIDFLARGADMVVRFQGGQNAGHTVINSFGKFVLHLLPSGVFHSGVINMLGPGVALDIKAFTAELAALRKCQVPRPKLLISNRAQIVLPVHPLLDQYEEERLGKDRFGSTRKGIAPFYADKYYKLGVQVADLMDTQRLTNRIEMNLVNKNILLQRLYGKPEFSAQRIVDELQETARHLSGMGCDSSAVIHQAIQNDKSILLEGQLGALRDPDHGIYPYVTSSSPLAGSACAGAGVPPRAIDTIIAVTKAYSTCVGAGPFVTEISGEEAEILRARGGDSGEFGATTGRPRRVGWFDSVATRYGCRLQGATEAALSMLDVLGYLKEVPICVAYDVRGKRIEDFPPPAILDTVMPVYENCRGWECDISRIRDFDDLPPQAKTYIRRIEALIEVPIRWVSVGPQREAIFRIPA